MPALQTKSWFSRIYSSFSHYVFVIIHIAMNIEQSHPVMSLPIYRGYYTSLYSSLPAAAIQNLERAIWFKIIGRASDSRDVFDHELQPFRNFPVVIIERADLEFETGKWGAAWRVLNSKLKELREADADLDLPEHRLMALTWAMLGTRHRGDLASAVHEIERTQSWLRDVPVDKYTDIQASCIRRYVITCMFTILSSNYKNPDMELIPMHTTKSESSWAGLGQLRRSLTNRGMFNEASALLRVELNRTPLGDRVRVVEEFLSAIADIPSSRGRDFIEASVRLQAGSTHVLLQEIPLATEEMDKSEAAFNAYCVEFGVTDKDRAPHFEALKFERLSLIQDAMEKLNKTVQLAKQFAEVQSPKTGVCLAAASELAKLYYQYTAMEDFLNTFFDVQKRMEHYDEFVSEDVVDLVRHRNDLSSLTSDRLVDRQKSLEWIEGFFEQYPHFQSPSELSSLYRWRASLLRGLRRIEESKVADAKADELDASGPTLGKWLHMGAIRQNLPYANEEANPTGYGSEDEDAEFPFFAPWETVMGDYGKIKETLVRLILDWLLEDITTGLLTIAEVTKILIDPDFQMTTGKGVESTDIEMLRDVGAKKIHMFIFTAQEAPETCHEESYNGICDWLARPPKGERDTRLFCLFMLRESRQLHFSDMHFWDLRIRELNLLLELYPKLPRQIREFSTFNQGEWLSALALTYLAKLVDLSDLRGEETAELLSMAEEKNEEAVGELRQRHHPVQLAIQQRAGAQMCLLRILRIKQLSQNNVSDGMVESGETKTGAIASVDVNTPKTPTTPVDTNAFADIKTIRDIGLEKVKEADRIYTESELHASWSEGLDGVNDRQRIASFYANSATIVIAINLLLAEPGGVSPDTITNIWRWVQKSKARSLARTIGIKAAPPGLVSQIMASPEARPVYEEMLSLSEEIEKAKLSARFYLRRKIDVLQNSMKEIPLLRQLIDLREGTPLDVADIEAINAQVGSSIVLVDWFFLPGFLTGETGRLLLFTAKAKSQPTMNILTTTLEDTHAWGDKYITPSKWRDYREENLARGDARTDFDNMLGGLVAPLADLTKADEILVLCPSTTLHRLPLHALSIKEPDPHDSSQSLIQSLIHRNPIVYIHSHSLLRSCFQATKNAIMDPAAMNPQFLSGIPEPAHYYDKMLERDCDYSAGRESVQEFADWFKSELLIDNTATKTNFTKVATESRLLHLHTHCNWTFANPLDHHVEFPDLSGGEYCVQKLTTRDIFDIRVLPGTHVNVIACQGGVVDVKPGDEVMGLVPALLYSGASSTVSTLWKIRDTDGAEFARAFFDEFLGQCEEMSERDGGELGMVDIARAVSAAVRKMDDGETRPLYDWAGFVLHGFWQYPLSREDVMALAE